jgi:hypothetical protein
MTKTLDVASSSCGSAIDSPPPPLSDAAVADTQQRIESLVRFAIRFATWGGYLIL